MRFKKQLKPLEEKEKGRILQKYLGTAFVPRDFNDPTSNELGGTPQYTYLNLLDNWYFMKRSPKFSELINDTDRLIFICNSRGYYEDGEIERIVAKPVRDYREAILRLIDYEFGVKFADQSDGVYKDIRPVFLSMINGIESDYLATRRDNKI